MMQMGRVCCSRPPDISELFMAQERQHPFRFSKALSAQGINEVLGLGRALSYFIQRHPGN